MKLFATIPLKWIGLAGLIFVVSAAAIGWSWWLPAATSHVDGTITAFRRGSEAPDGQHDHAAEASHDDHDHDHESHAGHVDESSLHLSKQARRNIGLTREMIQPVELTTFRRSVTVPAVVVERPGRTRIQVATPMTGVVTHVHAVEGEAVEPGSLLFQIRLTHEDLVRAQTEFLKTLGELDVEQREVARLKEVTRTGAVAGKLLLDREYARDKLTALLQAQREALKLHGLSTEQVKQIESERRLLRELQVYAPSVDSHSHHELKLAAQPVAPIAFRGQNDTADKANELDRASSTNQVDEAVPLILNELRVHKGQSVAAGETLCVVSDYDELFIEGMAFEQDVEHLREASQQGWKVDAIFQQPGGEVRILQGLEIAYLANSVDTASRTLRFYVLLPNEIAKERRRGKSRYIEWKYLPGQRLQVRVPIEKWPEQIVLPVEAVAREGAESFVFQQNGDHFDRVPVHVKFRDQYEVVIENDGSLFPGDVVALRGAHQMMMTLKNKSGGGVDPHAGHSH